MTDNLSYNVLKFYWKQVKAKSILISTAIACFERLIIPFRIKAPQFMIFHDLAQNLLQSCKTL